MLIGGYARDHGKIPKQNQIDKIKQEHSSNEAMSKGALIASAFHGALVSLLSEAFFSTF